MVVLQTWKALAWHAGRASRETALASKSGRSRCSTCDMPKGWSSCWAKRRELWGTEEMGFIFITIHLLHHQGEAWRSNIGLPWQLSSWFDHHDSSVVTRPACPLTTSLGFWWLGLLEIACHGAVWAESRVRCRSCGVGPAAGDGGWRLRG